MISMTKNKVNFLAVTMFDNIISKYLPGCFGNVATKQDKNSKVWCFIALDKYREQFYGF